MAQPLVAYFYTFWGLVHERQSLALGLDTLVTFRGCGIDAIRSKHGVLLRILGRTWGGPEKLQLVGKRGKLLKGTNYCHQKHIGGTQLEGTKEKRECVYVV